MTAPRGPRWWQPSPQWVGAGITVVAATVATALAIVGLGNRTEPITTPRLTSPPITGSSSFTPFPPASAGHLEPGTRPPGDCSARLEHMRLLIGPGQVPVDLYVGPACYLAEELGLALPPDPTDRSCAAGLIVPRANFGGLDPNLDINGSAVSLATSDAFPAELRGWTPTPPSGRYSVTFSIDGTDYPVDFVPRSIRQTSPEVAEIGWSLCRGTLA